MAGSNLFMRRFIFPLLSLIFLVSFVVVPAPAYADSDPAAGLYGLTDTAKAAKLDRYNTPLPELIGNVIGAALSFISVLFFVLMLYGGIRWMLARGNDDEVKKALDTIIGAIIGILIVLGAYAITNFVFNSVSIQGGGGGGNGGGSGNGGGGPTEFVAGTHCAQECGGTCVELTATTESSLLEQMNNAECIGDSAPGACPADCSGDGFPDDDEDGVNTCITQIGTSISCVDPASDDCLDFVFSLDLESEIACNTVVGDVTGFCIEPFTSCVGGDISNMSDCLDQHCTPDHLFFAASTNGENVEGDVVCGPPTTPGLGSPDYQFDSPSDCSAAKGHLEYCSTQDDVDDLINCVGTSNDVSTWSTCREDECF